MAYLNQSEREALLDELKDLSFDKARAKIRGLDRKGRLAYYRNMQQPGQLLTRYVLESLGTAVTLVEEHSQSAIKESTKVNANYNFVEVIVEPTADNSQ